MSKTVFSVTMTIPFYETDVTGHVRLPYLLSLALMVSGQHSKALGVSDDWFFDVHGLFWAVAEHQLTINRLPVYDETIRIETSVTAYNRYCCYRLFEVYSATDDLLMTIVSTFVLVTYQSRQLAKIPKAILEPFQTTFAKKPPRSTKLKPLENYEERLYPVRYFDLDRNGHVNNSRYLEWVYDGLSVAFLTKHYPKEITIKYNKEVAPCQTVVARTWQEDLISQHAFLADGQLSTQVRVQWCRHIEKGHDDV